MRVQYTIIFFIIVLFSWNVGFTTYSDNRSSNHANTTQRIHEDDFYLRRQYGQQFLRAMRYENLEIMIETLEEERHRGLLPDWLVEYSRNLLGSCNPGSILFTGSDADTNAAWYLQYVEEFRRDVTVVPLGLLNKPWYVLIITQKEHLVQQCVSLDLTREEIINMDFYNWTIRPIHIQISEEVCREYHINSEGKTIIWPERQELFEQAGNYRHINRAIAVRIIQSNGWKRSIYFSVDCNEVWLDGLKNYLQISGIAYRLHPIQFQNEQIALDVFKTEEIILNLEHFRSFQNAVSKDDYDLKTILANYTIVFRYLARYFLKIGDPVRMQNTMMVMNRVFTKDCIPPPFLE